MKAAVSPVAVANAIKGAVKGGMPVGTFKVTVDNGVYTILPVRAGEALDPGQEAERNPLDRVLRAV